MSYALNWLLLTKSGRAFALPSFSVLSTPAGARTLDTLIKSQVLYQLSYGCILFRFAGAKVRSIFESTKLFGDFFQKKTKKSSKTEVLSFSIRI